MILKDGNITFRWKSPQKKQQQPDFLRPNKDATVSALSRFIKDRNNVISVTDTSVKHSLNILH